MSSDPLCAAEGHLQITQGDNLFCSRCGDDMPPAPAISDPSPLGSPAGVGASLDRDRVNADSALIRVGEHLRALRIDLEGAADAYAAMIGRLRQRADILESEKRIILARIDDAVRLLESTAPESDAVRRARMTLEAVVAEFREKANG